MYIGSKYLYSRNHIMLFTFLYNVEKLSDTIELGSKSSLVYRIEFK